MRVDVMLGRVLGVLGGLHMMAMGDMRVVSRCFVIAFRVVLGGFFVMACSMFEVFRCLRVMLSCFVGHKTSFRFNLCFMHPRRIVISGEGGSYKEGNLS
jgi:hypothetical protein